LIPLIHAHCQADVVIAVNVGSPLLKAEEIGGLLSVSAQMVNLLTEQNVTRSLATLDSRDIYLKPDLEGITAADFQRTGETADRGVKAAEAAADRLRALAVDEATYTAWSQQLLVARRDAPRIDQIEIAGLKRVNPAAVERHLQVKPGDKMDPAAVNAQLLRAYGDGYYEHVDYALTRTLRGRNILRISPLEKSWGPDYLRYGINLDTNFSANSSYGLRVAYHKTWLNSLGGEIIGQAEIGSQPGITLDYYQPLDAAQGYFAESSLKIGSRLSGIYLDDERLADYKITEKVIRLGLGANLGLLGQLHAGWKETWYAAERDTGLPIFPELSLRYGGWTATLDMDQTDRLYFPTNGWSTRVHYFDSRTDNYSTLDAAASAYASIGDWVVSSKLSYQGSPQGQRPFYDIGSLGGMLNMTAFSPGQIKGDDIRYGQLRFERIVGRLPLGLRGDLRLGAALETAKIGHPITETHLRGWIKSGAIYIGGETPLGPVYLGYGYSNAGSTGGYSNLYLFLGTP
jgi:NTE family protein